MMSIANDATQNIASVDIAHRLSQGASHCVACGLCLKECPTYSVARSETDSPRGRIMLMRALANDQFADDGSLTTHLEQCLHCGRCERACPSNVPYMRMIDDAKTLLHKRQALATLPGWLDYLLKHPAAMKLLAWSVWLWQHSGAQKLARKQKLFKQTGIATLESMLPPPVPRHRQTVNGTNKGTVCLFTGCVGQISEGPTLSAVRHLVHASGFAVKTPVQQTCCGALHQHNGDPDTAQRCMQKNLAVFGDDIILSAATGCGAHWQHADARHYDIHDFLLEQDTLEFKPLRAKVALHTPCTAYDALRQSDAPLRLLQRIPELEVMPLPDKTGCCGAGGAHVLEPSKIGDGLIEEKVDALRASGAGILLTPNTGCAMHFRRKLHSRGMDISVMHPIVLLYRQHNREAKI